MFFFPLPDRGTKLKGFSPQTKSQDGETTSGWKGSITFSEMWLRWSSDRGTKLTVASHSSFEQRPPDSCSAAWEVLPSAHHTGAASLLGTQLASRTCRPQWASQGAGECPSRAGLTCPIPCQRWAGGELMAFSLLGSLSVADRRSESGMIRFTFVASCCLSVAGSG